MSPTTDSEEPTASPRTPYRQIRASHDEHTITIYQAYSPDIAEPAVAQQNLAASPAFSGTRMTWIKPSWCWMMYRSGYSYKDERQTRILALKIPHAKFRQLLMESSLSEPERRPESDLKVSSKQAKVRGHGSAGGANSVAVSGSRQVTGEGSGDQCKAKGKVRIQWDPERGPRLELLPYRSIQIGIGKDIVKFFVEECVVGIEDVTEKAREMKKVFDEACETNLEDLIERGLMPSEKVYQVDEELRKVLGMNEEGKQS